MTKKKAIVSVINDLATDQRVQKTCQLLVKKGFAVILIGRKLPGSIDLPIVPYECVRMKMLFKKGPAFYFFFNLRLFFFLVFKKADLLVANDLDTIIPNYIISLFKKVKLIYDSHEIFCEVPELKNSLTKKMIWEKVESLIVPKLKLCLTVNESIAKWFLDKYNVKFEVCRNIPETKEIERIKNKKELGLPESSKIVLLQGAGININRGAEELVEAMKYIDGVVLLIIGGGDVIENLKNYAKMNCLEEKIIFKNKMAPSLLFHYTSNADLGISIDKQTNVNYNNSLPNKIFDYIQAGLPIVASRIKEIEKIISEYNIGVFIENHDPLHIAATIKSALYSENYLIWKKNTNKAFAENTWEKEKIIWEKLIDC